MQPSTPTGRSSSRNDGARAGSGQTLARRGRRIARIALVSALILVAAGAGSSALAADPPRIVVENGTVDLGRILRGDGGTAEFTIRNAGGSPLVIEDALPSCRCTVASYDETIAPGATGRLTATLETDELWGAVTRVVDLATNDPQTKYSRLTIVAEVIGSVDIMPAHSAQISNRRPEFTEARLLLRKTAEEQRELRVANLSASVPWLAVSAERVEERRPAAGGLPTARPGDWVLTIRLAGQAPNGRSEPVLRFTTDLELEPEFMIPIQVDYRPPLTLSSQQVVLLGDRAESGELVTITLRDGLDAANLKVETEPAGLSAVLHPGGDGRLEMRVRWTGESSGQGSVTLSVAGESHRLPVVRADR